MAGKPVLCRYALSAYALMTLDTRFTQLTELLNAHQSFWRLIPFDHLDLPWTDEAPAFANWLQQCSQNEINALDADFGGLLNAITPFLPETRRLAVLCTLDPLSGRRLSPSRFWRQDTPGRKWEQVLAFASVVSDDGAPILEWCCGKAHLGRTLALLNGVTVTGLDRDAVLCQAGARLADRLHAPVRFVNADAFSPEATACFADAPHVVALHACGDLHTVLLEQGTQNRSRSITIAPCCFHRIREVHYTPISALGRSQNLELTRFELKLPLQEMVTGDCRARRYREIELLWRIGFDLLQRNLTGSHRYHQVPKILQRLLAGDFDTFCRWAAQAIGLALPETVKLSVYLERAYERRVTIARIELVRHIFRRPLETWLLLDRALLLQEQGYRVDLGTFCDRSLTPRNVIIKGTL